MVRPDAAPKYATVIRPAVSKRSDRRIQVDRACALGVPNEAEYAAHFLIVYRSWLES